MLPARRTRARSYVLSGHGFADAPGREREGGNGPRTGPGGALIDASTPFGKRVLERLEREHVIWLTTTGRDGTPQPNPVWFLWQNGTFLIYSLPDAARVRNLERSPRVALHFDSNGQGGDVVVFTGEARLAPGEPPSHKVPAYQARYERRIRDGLKMTPEQFAARYSLAIRVTPSRVRGF